ncbi:two-component sensor histidine kinase [Cycloclasticus sp. 46_120_T64]|nr:two-component sensor histidine kinase [Cycloclasticus sp. 46_120_T64]
MITTNSADSLVRTCSLGNGFQLPAGQAWRMLKVFHAYQLVLSSAFFALFVSHTGPSIFGQSNPSLFHAASLSYLALTAFSTVFIRKPYIAYARQVQFKIISDIALLTVLMHASGGISSGLGALLAVSVAAGGLLAGGQCTLLFAAIATFAVLGEQSYADVHELFDKTSYTYAGVLSASFFTIAMLALVLAKRVETSEQITRQQSREINELTQLNSFIISQLQAGIIVINRAGEIRLNNEAAKTLLGQKLRNGHPLAEYSSECWQLFKHWLNSDDDHSANRAATANLPQIKLSFSLLDTTLDEAYIIFIDDLSNVDHEIQQGKLASLGRLTASIAHEIRNPLGAISHAGELLAESDSIRQEDQRLLEIIHNHSARVNSIVKNILELSRHDKSHIEPIILTDWLKEFSLDFSEQFGLAESPLDIQVQADACNINFDKNHLKQIIDNLCSNALKYGKQGELAAKISIQTGINNINQQTFISIIDNGTGIDSTNAQKIFEPFFTTSASGTGLGLYISSQLAVLNHAKLSYSKHANGGSCFTLLFT